MSYLRWPRFPPPQSIEDGREENVKFDLADVSIVRLDLAPSDYHLFSTLKEHLGGYRFQSDEDVKTAVSCCLNRQDTTFYESDRQIGLAVRQIP
ncbi:hypothetical protein AVEN_99900-1 [Araneus ventricosus]|uniref:Uncharacterized protein n=1 Tax=Araneus ventricosus TaxID=182803 RepID=A0A4Y2CJV9_ARAVE|nr:hypothetical protein AVEN_99900-1 [Araneus ventricosus]